MKCKFICSIGTTWANPPPAAPPFIPNEGPRLGSLKQTIDFLPILFKPSLKPTEVVVFPSPAGVGVIAVTNISFPSGLFFNVSKYSKLILAICLPIGLNAKVSSGTSTLAKISLIGSILASLAIWISDFISLIRKI